MHAPIVNNVSLASAYKGTFGCRRGTVFETLDGFARKFGNPHVEDFSEDGLDGAGKVHAIWTVETPRGIVEVRDYWWNPKDQLSIGAPNGLAALWCRAWLRLHGVKCSGSNGK